MVVGREGEGEGRTSHREVMIREPRVTDVLVILMHVCLKSEKTFRDIQGRSYEVLQRCGRMKEDVDSLCNTDTVRVM